MTRISSSRLAVAGFAVAAALFAGAAGATPGDDHKVSICHATSSETNPFNLISIDVAAVPAHLEHGDVFPDGDSCERDGGGE